MSMTISRRLRRDTLIIPAGAAESQPLFIGARILLWVQTPPGLLGTFLQIVAGDEPASLAILRDSGGQLVGFSLPATPGDRLAAPVPQTYVTGHEVLALRTGQASAGAFTPTVQAADQAIAIATWDPYT